MANEYLKRTPTSTGNRKVFTWSGWIKLNEPSVSGTNGDRCLLSATDPVTNGDDDDFRIVRSGVPNGAQSFYWNSSEYNVGGEETIYTNTVVRDVSSWQHVILVKDSTQTTSQDRVKIYVNGVRQQISEADAVTQNADRGINSLIEHNIGEHVGQNRHFHGEMSDVFFVDGQALTPDVFGFYKDGNGYISAGSTQSTDFRPGQWVPKTPRVIKAQIERNGGFGVNGYYLPMNDSSNFGADFHTTPNSIITLKGEDLPQPRNGAPTTTDAYVSQLRTDPYAANLVLAVPGISTSTSANLITNGNFDSNISGWTTVQATTSWQSGLLRIIPNSGVNGAVYQSITTEVGKRYTVTMEIVAAGAANGRLHVGTSTDINSVDKYTYTSNHLNNIGVGKYTTSFTPTTTTTIIWLEVGGGVQTQIDFDNVVVRQEDAPRDYSADIKGSGTNKTLTANGNAGVGYEIPSYYGSALSFDGSGDYFTSPANDSDFQFGSGDFTIECWVKADTVSANGGFVGIWNNTDNRRSWLLYHNASASYNLSLSPDGSSSDLGLSGFTISNTNEWNHIVGEREGSIARLYVNGVVVGINTDLGSTSLYTNTDDTLAIGTWNNTNDADNTFDGYIQDLRVYKGVAKYKGGFDVPKPYTPVGIKTWRAVPDCTANNFATLNGVYADYNSQNGSASYTLSNGNLTFLGTGNNDNQCGTIGVSTGKWYYEARLDNVPERSVSGWGCGINTTTANIGSINYYTVVGSRGDSSNLDLVNRGTIYADNVHSPSAGDIVAYALDLDSNPRTLTPYINGVGFATTSIIAPIETFYYPLIGDSSATDSTITVNFGQNPTFSGNTTAGTYTDSNGKGLFKYEPPSGFLALCEDNLPTPAIKNPGEYFKTVLYTGDGSLGRSITGIGFTPDLVWVKNRTGTNYHLWYDSVRGPGFSIFSNSTDSEQYYSGGSLLSFDSDGYSVNHNSNTNSLNTSGGNIVAWCWRAGAGTTSTNTDGSIDSVVSVNQDAGFSIVSYTGNETAGATIGHGLGKTPGFIIFKSRETALNWGTYHKSLGATQRVLLDSPAAAAADANAFNNTEPTSSIITLGASDVYNDNKKMIAYCWAEIEGFSKFGSYIGNSSTDGPFVYCGFKPAWVMIKNTTDAGGRDWAIQDSSRAPSNPCNKQLKPNQTEIENGGVADSTFQIDMLSNGFKVRNNTSLWNENGDTIIFAAFAESPFTTANAK